MDLQLPPSLYHGPPRRLLVHLPSSSASHHPHLHQAGSRTSPASPLPPARASPPSPPFAPSSVAASTQTTSHFPSCSRPAPTPASVPPSQTVCWNSMLGGYAKNDKIVEARDVFDRMEYRDVVPWNTIIYCYVFHGDLKVVGELFAKMPKRDVISWNFMLVGHAKCGDVERARRDFQISDYDPLDMFFGSKERIYQAIMALIVTPQNNFRVFLNEAPIFGGSGSGMAGSVQSHGLTDTIEDVIRATGLCLAGFYELITEATFQFGMLDRLIAAQKLDSLDIEGAVHTFYNIILSLA